MQALLRMGLRPRLCLQSFEHYFIKPHHLRPLAVPACSVRGIADFTRDLTPDTTPDLTPDATLDLTPDLTSFTENVTTIAQTLTTEPSFTSIGLANWTPPGLAQYCLEQLHVAHHIPWWGTIVIGTLCVRIIIFPLVIKAQRNMAHMHNNSPQMMAIQNKMMAARQAGDNIEAQQAAMELTQFMQDKKLNPLKSLLVPFAQMPFFVSFFLGLRDMAACPVESMKHGGLYWFEDLTIADPLYGLPLITCTTLALTIELGADGDKMSTPQMAKMRNIIRLMPLVMFPFLIKFPAAILCYWASSNFISLVQVGILKIPAVRTYLQIPVLIKHPPSNGPTIETNFTKGFKESWNNIKITQEMEERRLVAKRIEEKKKNYIEFDRSKKSDK